MAMDTKETTDDHDESEEEGEVDLEEELISSLEELNKERKKNKLLKKELSRIREDTQNSTMFEEVKQAYLDLKVHLEEAKVIEESLRKRLEEKEEIQEELEKEIVMLKRKLQKETIKQNFDKSTKILNQIIDSQRSIHDKTSLGYNKKLDELGSSSKMGKGDKRSHVDIAKENCEPSKENLQKEGTRKHEEDE